MAEVIIIDYNENVITGDIHARMACVTIGNVIMAINGCIDNQQYLPM